MSAKADVSMGAHKQNNPMLKKTKEVVARENRASFILRIVNPFEEIVSKKLKRTAKILDQIMSIAVT